MLRLLLRMRPGHATLRSLRPLRDQHVRLLITGGLPLLLLGLKLTVRASGVLLLARKYLLFEYVCLDGWLLEKSQR